MTRRTPITVSDPIPTVVKHWRPVPRVGKLDAIPSSGGVLVAKPISLGVVVAIPISVGVTPPVVSAQRKLRNPKLRLTL